MEPTIILKDHLQYVGQMSEKIIASKKLNIIDANIIMEISYLIGISHDFGKYTTYFQDKLQGKNEKRNPLTYHGLISALFAFELIEEYIRKNNYENEKPYMFLPLMAYFVVKHHHGDLNNIETDIDSEQLFNVGFKSLHKQLENIWTNKDKITKEYDYLLRTYDLSTGNIFLKLEKYKKPIIFSADIKSLVKELNNSLYLLLKREENKNINYYLIIQLLYSVLIDSDKKHAGGVKEIERRELPSNIVDEYLKSHSFKEDNKSGINRIREEIRKSVLKNISDSSSTNQKIFTLTAPTGTGKTLTSLSAGLKLRKILKTHLNLTYEPRIIYSLPFTSIIDQNYAVFDNVLNHINDFSKNESQYLLKHHHMSEIFYKIEGVEETDLNQSLALIESWESEIVVTTFIQLFYTLIGYKNRSLKKFHNIVNSIIILDEAQNIPIEYWDLVREILIGMTEYFNCRILLMTATKPLIFREGEYKELVDDHEDYFKTEDLNRVSLQINNNKREISIFCNELNDWSKNSYLFVFNTIGSSLDFYKLIIDKNRELRLNFKVCYLSTNVIPVQRKKRIEAINKQIKCGQKIIVVSTQMIEAGVDIDCDCVYRDMGPLDSIIQVAGRCNRNKRLEKAEVHLVNLVDINGRSFTNIYDSVLLYIVDNLLKNKKTIHEIEFIGLINNYFEEAKMKSGSQTKIIRSIHELYFDDRNPDINKRIPISDFKLIKDDYYKIDIFIELDETATEVKKRYCEILTIKDPIERKMEFLKIKKQFYDYVISVPKNYALGFKEGELGYVNDYELESYYDKETGFKRENAGCGTIIC